MLVVWSANGNTKVVLLLPRLVPIYKMTILTDAFVWIIVSSIRTNKARFALCIGNYMGLSAIWEKICTVRHHSNSCGYLLIIRHLPNIISTARDEAVLFLSV